MFTANSKAKPTLLGMLILPFLVFGCSPPDSKHLTLHTESPRGAAVGPFDHSHALLDSLMQKYVTGGLVDYVALQADQEMLYRYTAALGGIDRTVIATWSRKEQLAFWINAYNALTLQVIVKRYPITSRSFIGLFFPGNSILQIPGVWSRLKFPVGGRRLSLGEIEHEILRQEFSDPRIHFAIVCASSSCPPLRAEAYRADILEHQLEAQAARFINDPRRGVRYDGAKNRLYVSKIFFWFKEDFISESAEDQPIVRYLLQYLRDDEVRAALTGGQEIRLSSLPYDWRLNDRQENDGQRSVQ